MTNKMYLYLWSEDDTECKFGERWVFDGQDPMTEITKRIRSSMGVRKDKFDQGDVTIHQIWDVSELAKRFNKFYKQSRMDDLLRSMIGFRKGTTGEIHTLPGADFQLRVNKLIKDLDGNLIDAGLSTAQYEVAVDVVSAINTGSKTILAELCARFGKTIWSSAVATETDQDLVIVSSYVQTVFASFAGDIIRFNQFKEYEHVDLKDDDYQQKIEDAYANGKKVMAYLSLNNGGKRQQRIDYLFGLNKKRMLIIDEADFGAHKAGQAEPLREARKDDDVVLIMTGTNADRAATGWNLDHIVSTNYFELLTHKKDALEA